MRPGSEELDRLITRFLDEEADTIERRKLSALERTDPEIAALVEEYVTIDREVAGAMRHALGRGFMLPRRRSAWVYVRQLTGLAAAAALTLFVWIGMPRHPANANGPAQAGSASWFQPAAHPQQELPHDEFRPDAQWFDRPHEAVRDRAREWIIVPGERPGEYMIVEVNRVQTRAVTIQRDF